MKTNLLLVGKTTDRNLDSLIQDYSKRISRYTAFETTVIPDIKSGKSMSPDILKNKEGELILQSLRPGDYVILLDERGQEFRSLDFSTFISRQFNMSHRRMVFIIGGAYGFSQDVYNRSQFMISLSQMTFSHQMIRLLFTEQLYRALTIMAGEPYHHEG